MKFREISEKEYRKFWEKSERKSFLSAPEMGHVRDDFKLLFYGVFEKEKLVAAAMIRGTRRRFSSYDFYAPRGFLADYSDKNIIKFFAEHLKKELIKNGGYILRIEPNVELVERDINGNIVTGGYDNKRIIETLSEAGFKKVKYVEGESQITWEFVLPVKGLDEQTLLSNMKPNTRRMLKAVENYKIQFKELGRDEIKEFYEILKQTAGRKNFQIRDLAYYEKIYDLYGAKGVKYVSAFLNPKNTLISLKEQKKEIMNFEPQTAKEKREHKNAIGSIDARIEKIKDIFKDVPDEDITLSSGMFYTLKPEILYCAGGNADKYVKLDAQYALQWRMIREALNEGYDQYNFYGIIEDIDQHQDNGVYKFKKGFDGKVVQLVGEFEMVLDKKKYLLNKMTAGLSKILKK